MKRPFHTLRVWALLAAALLQPGANKAYGQAMRPGVTVWVYNTGEAMTQLPTLIDGQTPSYADDLGAIDFSSGWPSGQGSEGQDPLTQYYLGLVWGKLKVTTAGEHQLRVISDDGAQLWINGALVVSNDVVGQTGERTATAAVTLAAGSHRLDLKFYQNTGNSRLRLEWKPPGASGFVLVPLTSLETEDGQTHVVAPGLKRFYYENGGGQPGGPGDGRPLTGVHPSYTLGNFRPFSFQPQIGGMDFLPDGRLAVSTWDALGGVYILGNLSGPAENVTITRFAEGLGEPLGLKVVAGEIYVAQKGEVTRLRDTDSDGKADVYETVAKGWPASHNYHEFTFGLVHKGGKFYVTTSMPLKTGDSMYMPTTLPVGEDSFAVPNGPGSLIEIDPTTRSWQIIGSGLRTPNGLGIGPSGELFCGDNQGGWVPTSKLNFLQAGGFYGHQEAPNGTVASERPALWLPHDELSNSPAEPTVAPSGPYAGQVLFAELTQGGVTRAALEKVNGKYQGAAFRFTQGLESGMNRVAWAPDGSLYLGGIGSNGNWNWKNTLFGLQRLTYNGGKTFEMKSIRSRANGFIVDLTYQAPFSILSDPANYTIQQWQYTPTASYGGSKQNVTALTPSSIKVAPDRRRVFFELPNLQAGRVVYFRLNNFQSDSPSPVAPWTTEGWYTLNNIAPETGPDFTPVPALPTLTPGGGGSPVDVVQQAESAVRSSGAAIESNHAGYNGTGFVNYPASGYVEFNISAAAAGSYQIQFRYALGASPDRPLTLTVNGAGAAVLNFPITGAWTSWQTVSVTRTLNVGANTIRLSTTNDGPNLDQMTVIGAGSVGGAVQPSQYLTHWAQTFGLTGSSAASAADPDKDGLSNLLEYGIGGRPNAAKRGASDLPLEPNAVVSRVAFGNLMQITYRRRIDFAARGLSYEVQGSATLGGAWNIVPCTQIGEATPTGDGETELVTVQANAAIPAGQGSQFLRVMVRMAGS